MLSNARKALMAFLGVLATNVVADLMQDGHPFPTNWGDAARWALTLLLTTAGTYQIRPARGVNTPPPAAGGAAVPGGGHGPLG